MHVTPTSGATIAVLLAAGVPAGWAAARVATTYAAEPRPALAGPVIILTVLLFGWAAVVAPPGWLLGASLGLAWTLVCLALIDFISMRLPDLFTLPMLAAGLAIAFLLPAAPVADHLAGTAGGYGFLALIGWGYRKWRNMDGIGLGDAKLFAAAGAWLGWSPLPSVLLIACGAALAWVAVAAIVRGRSVLRARLAFGAPLCLAIWIVWLHGPLTL